MHETVLGMLMMLLCVLTLCCLLMVFVFTFRLVCKF